MARKKKKKQSPESISKKTKLPGYLKNIDLWLIALIAAAIIMRIIYTIQNQLYNPLFDEPVNDAKVYYDWAKGLASGEWVQDKPFYMAPFYAHFLSIVFRLFSESTLAVVIIQHVAGVISLYLIYIITKKVFSRNVALLAVFLTMLHAPIVFKESKILLPALTVLLYLLVLHVLLLHRENKPNFILALLSGLLIGIAIIHRPNLLLFVPLVVIWFYVLNRTNIRAWAAMSVLLIAGVFIPILPVTIHNYNVSGDFILLTTNTGVNFYYGANPDAAPTFTRRAMISDSIVDEQEKAKEIAEEAMGQKLSEKEVSSYWMREGFKQITKTPLRWLAYQFKKIYWSINTYEIINNYNIAFEKTKVPVLNAYFIPFGLISLFGIVGIVLAPKRDPKVMLLLMYLGALYIGLIAFTVVSRFRIPLTVILAGYAAYGIIELIKLARKRHTDLAASRKFMIALIVLILLAVPTLVPYRQATNPASTYHTLAILEYQKGNYKQAIEYNLLSIEHYPNAEAYNNLGSSYKQMKIYDKSLEYYNKASETNPRYHASRFNAGLVHFELEQYNEAIEKFEEAIKIYPNYIRAREKLAFSMVYVGRNQEALDLLRDLAQRQPEVANHNFNLGMVLSVLGDHQGAIEQFQIALQKNPDYEEARDALQKLNQAIQ